MRRQFVEEEGSGERGEVLRRLLKLLFPALQRDGG
jgi:hypothetical protein